MRYKLFGNRGSSNSPAEEDGPAVGPCETISGLGRYELISAEMNVNSSSTLAACIRNQAQVFKFLGQRTNPFLHFDVLAGGELAHPSDNLVDDLFDL